MPEKKKKGKERGCIFLLHDYMYDKMRAKALRVALQYMNDVH